jgi:hypothetical protein
MNEQFIIYLWSISENVQLFLFLTGVFGTIFGTIGAAIICCESVSKWRFTSILVPIICVFMLLFSNLIPSKNDIALIWAYPYIKQGAIQVVSNEQVKKLPDNVLKVANTYLEKTLKDLDKENIVENGEK